MSAVLEFPDDFVQAVSLPESEFIDEARMELALAFYIRGAISIGRAAEFGGLGRARFEALLAERKIERPFSEAEIDQELEWADTGARDHCSTRQSQLASDDYTFVYSWAGCRRRR